MSQSKSLAIGAFVLFISIIGGGWFLEIAPQLSIVSTVHKDHANVLALNAKNQLLLTKLKADFQNIGPLKSQLDRLSISVPPSANISAFISEVNSMANAHKTTIKSLIVSDAKPYTLSAPPPSDNGIKEPSSPQSNPKITSANFVVIPIQITASGQYTNVLDFINSIQMGQRLFLISALSSTGSMGGNAGGAVSTMSGKAAGKVDASIGGYIYVLLD